MPKRDSAYMESRRDQILDATAACLLRSGLDGLSTTAICAEAGISTGALYTHFKGKGEILRALAERSARDRASALQGEGIEALRSGLQTLVDEQRSEAGKAISRVDLQFLSRMADQRDFAAAIAQLHDNDDFAAALRRLAERGELRDGVDPVVASAALESLLMGVKVLTLMGDKHAGVYGAAVDLLLDAITTTPPRAD